MCVLLVEDEALIREVMAESLQDAGYEVLQVENGVVALDLLLQPPKSFTALVTDFHMPGGVDGAEAAAQARGVLPSIPVIIVSGRPDVLRVEWKQRHGYYLLKKLYRPSGLVKLVHSLVEAPPKSTYRVADAWADQPKRST